MAKRPGPSRRERVHVLASLTEPDRRSRGRPRVFGYGYRWIAMAAGVSTQKVRDAVARKSFDPADPIDVVRWIVKRRGMLAVARALAAIRGVLR